MDIGNVLQEARIAKNLTLDTVSRETNIRKLYLEAIERNDFAALSGDVFVKGVIRTYGNYLGLDGTKLVEEYKADSAGNVPAKNSNTIRESKNVKVQPSFKSHRDIGSGTESGHNTLFIVAGVILALLLAAGGFYFYLAQAGKTAALSLPFFSSDSNEIKNDKANEADSKSVAAATENKQTKERNNANAETGANDKKEMTVQEKRDASAAGNENGTAAATAVSNAANPSGMTALTLTSTGKCWLRVSEQNGSVLYEGNLLKGESREFSSKAAILVRFGNLKDMRIEYNGTLLPHEETREAVTRIYTPSGEETK